MAIMIPKELKPEEYNDSLGEQRVYAALSSLPDDYIVFYSVRWNKKHVNGRVQWGESDFMVLSPTRGILVIEVKSGGISCKDGRWYQTNLKTNETHQLPKSPILQADFGKYTFLDLFSESRNQYVRDCKINSIVWFPSISSKESIGVMPVEYNRSIVFTQNDLNNPIESLNKAFDFYEMWPKQNVQKNDVNLLVSTISPNFNLFPTLSNEADDQNYTFRKLTNEQETLLDYLDEQDVAVIQGGGGTGKTVLALEKARRLSSNSKVLFLCFNKMLLEHLRETYGALAPNISFFNLQSLYLKMTGNNASEISDDDITDFLNEYDKYGWDFKHIIVDEGQDFADTHLDYLSTIAKMNNGVFYVFYDKNQLVQRYDNNTWLDNANCRLVLSKNCRNTYSIAHTAFSSIGIDNIKMGSNVEGKKPTLSIVKDKTSGINNISNVIRFYKEQGFQKNQITILTLKTENKSILSDELSVGGYRISRNRGDGEILFTSARKFKGLESEVVIVIDLDEATFSSDENRNLFYVAASRAKNFLHIVCSADDEGIENLSINMFGERKNNPKLAISSYLKVKIVDNIQ